MAGKCGEFRLGAPTEWWLWHINWRHWVWHKIEDTGYFCERHSEPKTNFGCSVRNSEVVKETESLSTSLCLLKIQDVISNSTIEPILKILPDNPAERGRTGRYLFVSVLYIYLKNLSRSIVNILTDVSVSLSFCHLSWPQKGKVDTKNYGKH